jgi:hypothetical protein
MNPPKCDDQDYINFLVATPRAFSALEAARAQRNHIGLALRAFLLLEVHCYRKGTSWFEAKTSIIREAVRAYLAKPLYTLNPTA